MILKYPDKGRSGRAEKSRTPRIALILHLASGGTGSVSAEAITMAIRWADYLEAHARRVYAAAKAAPVDTAKLIWKRIENAKLKCWFTARDIYTQGRSQLKDKAEVERGFGALVHAYWLAMRPNKTYKRGLLMALSVLFARSALNSATEACNFLHVDFDGRD